MAEIVVAREQKRQFIRDLDVQMKDHESWLILVRYGMLSLLEDQDVLIEIICNESDRRYGNTSFVAGVVDICSELGLKLVAA